MAKEISCVERGHRWKAIIALFIVSWLASAPATAQTGQGAYPTKAVRLIVGFPAGGPVDTLARVLAKQLVDTLAHPVVIDNRAGANGIVGTTAVAKAAPDGYTLLMGASTMSIQATLVPNLPYDAVRDLTPIAGVASAPLLLIVNPSVPARTVTELVAFMKSKPGQVNYASPSSGSANHLAAEMLKTMTGTDALHIPYKGGAPAEVDLIGGRVAFMFHAIPAALPHVRAGRLRAVAVAAERRSPAAPDIPTFAESGLPGFRATTWYGVLGPAGLSRDVVIRVNVDVNKALQGSEMKTQMANFGSEPMPGTPEQFGEFIKREIVTWAKVIRDSGATSD